MTQAAALRGAAVVPAARLRRRVGVPIAVDGKAVGAEFVSFHGLVDGLEHVALVFGAGALGPEPLVRIHSECLTGDVFGSCRCDCGPQLADAKRLLAAEGGIVLYLRQEGRGIGLYNKLDAYALQDRGHDTFDANRALGFGDDLRDFTVAAQMLVALGVHRVRLLTNNPDKVAQLTRCGIEVAAVCQRPVQANEHNRDYLQAKRVRAGHLFALTAPTP